MAASRDANSEINKIRKLKRNLIIFVTTKRSVAAILGI